MKFEIYSSDLVITAAKNNIISTILIIRADGCIKIAANIRPELGFRIDGWGRVAVE